MRSLAYVTGDYFKENETVFGQFLRFASIRTYKKGNNLICQGEEYPGFFLLLKGVLCASAENKEGHRKVLTLLCPRNLIGVSAVKRRPSLVNYECLTTVEAGFIPKEKISEWTDEMLLFFAQIQTRKSHGLQKQVEYSRYYTTEERALMILSEYKKQILENPYAGLTETGMRKQLLADILGITNVHLSNTIAKLKENRCITSTRSRLYLLQDNYEKML